MEVEKRYAAYVGPVADVLLEPARLETEVDHCVLGLVNRLYQHLVGCEDDVGVRDDLLHGVDKDSEDGRLHRLKEEEELSPEAVRVSHV